MKIKVDYDVMMDSKVLRHLDKDKLYEVKTVELDENDICELAKQKVLEMYDFNSLGHYVEEFRIYETTV